MRNFLLALSFLAPFTCAEVVVITNPSGPDAMDANQVRDLFIGRSKSLPNGQSADPIDLESGQALREEFHNKVTGRSQAQLNAFWSKQVFTGKGQPPRTLDSTAAVKAAVASTPGAIGYIDSSEVDASVKVVLTP
ncbi:phosphate ABC transporter substrate-binding protein [Gilvimarinus sp. DA14]|uniref:phosphate ABC transporter substrate-binding protein n=1 Tax=Gilvimarinus sp. DA14 TaxID=2956798 RepID=UPI0020B86129|nr:phosphate ABC transporter substrate-binding protein [Gilvimarinus sp. DA14]UTF59533.1 phosphate ABC transporter substrate-binding protein [Gilvimarinus sp. DA14]